MSEPYAIISDDGVPLEDLEGISDREERLQAALWADIPAHERHHYECTAYSGRPSLKPRAVCAWLDHVRAVKRQNPEVLQTLGGIRCANAVTQIYGISLKVLCAKGTSQRRQKEIAAAFRKFSHKGCHFTDRDEGPIWTFTDRDEYVAAG